MLKEPLHKLLRKSGINGRDLTVFLLSLLLAFSIWISHNLSLQYSSVVSVPVIALSNIEGHQAESSNTSPVVARCRTTGYRLLRKNRMSRRGQLRVYFSPDDLHQEDEDLYYITSNELSGYFSEIFGDNVQLESFVSSRVQFRFPAENHKTVPVQAVSVVSFKPQYMALGAMKIVPDSVVVYGEPLHLQNIDRVVTEAITLQNLSSGAHGMARLEAPKGGIRLSVSEVSYALDVTRYVELHREVKVGTRNVPAGRDLTVYPSVVDVVFRCVFPLAYDPTEGVSFYVDYNDFASSINGRCVPRDSGLPSSVIDYSVEPKVLECIENLR
ncbi:MAG: hypothetical protein IKH60_07375 [Bacteroidales bacterium]|nr:hypothetical protein [Bacteroidales bacterium]